MTKKNKGQNIVPIGSKSKQDNMMEMLNSTLRKEMEMEEANYLADQMMNMLPSLMTTTTEIAKLVIENRVRNSEKMSDEDIYQIYRESFQRMNKVFSEQ